MEKPELGAKFVARSHEATTLKAALQKAIEGVGSTLLISGEAGIGKTRLAVELMNYAASKKVKVLFGRAVPHNFTPYLVFVDAFEEMFAIRRRDDSSTRLRKITDAIQKTGPETMEALPLLTDLMIAGAPTAVLGLKAWLKGSAQKRELGLRQWLRGPAQVQELGLEPPARKEKLFDIVTHLILRTSSSQPILMILDDLQWADPSSLGLLHYLSRNIRSASALILGTYRIEELQESESGLILLDTLRLMLAEDLVDELVLDRLSESEVKELLHALLRSDLPEPLVTGLYSGTQGNPLFIIESVKLLMEEGAIVRTNESWTVSRAIEKITIPRKVREVITRRLARLVGSDREILDCASVVGDSFESAVLGKALAIDKTKLLGSLNNVDKKYRLIRYSADAYHFDHTLIREVVYEELNDELRRHYHGRVAAALEVVHSENLEAYESILAHHYMKAGFHLKAREHYIRAAESAKQKFANEEAILHLTAALRLVEEDPLEKARLLEEIGDLLRITGKFDDAIQSWRQAISLQEGLGRRISAAILHGKMGRVLGMSLGRVGEALKEFETAKGFLSTAQDENGLAELCQSYAALHAQNGNFAEAIDWCKRAIALSEGDNLTTILARSYSTLGTILLSKGQIEQGLQYLDKALEKALSEQLNDTAMDVYNNLGVTFETQGQFVKASEYFEKGLQLAKKAGYLSELPWLYDGLATTYLHSGNLEKALKAAEAAVSLDRSQGQFRHLAIALCSLGRVQFRLGQVEKARELFEEALKLAEQTDDHQALVEACAGLGEIALKADDFEKANVLLQRASEFVERTGDPRLASKVFPLVAAMHIISRNIQSCRTVLEKLETAATQTNSPAVSAIVHRMWGQFYALLGEWDRAFESFGKGLQIYQGINQPHEEAEMMIQLALAHAKRGTREDLIQSDKLFSNAKAIFESVHEWYELRRLETERARIQQPH